MKPEEKNATVNFSLTSIELEILRDAAEANNQNLAEFVLESALNSADNVLKVHSLTENTPRETNKLYLSPNELEQELEDTEEILKPKLKKLFEEDFFGTTHFVD